MNCTRILGLLVISLLFPALAAQSGINAHTATLLRTYNITNSTISQISVTNITYSGKTYSELFLNSNPYLLVNTTKSTTYSFVIGEPSIAAIITNNTIKSKISTLGLTSIAATMGLFLNSSAPAINDCLVETGLSGGTCTLANGCQSCQFVPACNRVLEGTGGPGDTFGLGIINFSQDYHELSTNSSLFFKSTSNVSVNNFQTDIANINLAFKNLYNITNNIYQNPIFPPPASINYTSCQTIGVSTLNTSLAGAPWYCNAVGFCELTTYNYTQLIVIQGMINTLNSNAPTSTYINSVATSINNTVSAIIVPQLNAAKASQLRTALNTTLLNYGTVVNETSALLSHLPNATLSVDLSILEHDYNNLKSNYLGINVTIAASGVSKDLANVTSAYSVQAPLYTKILATAKNNTALLIALQTQSNNPAVSSIAYNETQINAMISGSAITNTTGTLASLNKISTQAKSQEGVSANPSGISRAVDGPFITALAPSLGLSYQAAIASVPALSAVLSLIIGIVVLLIAYLYYHGLKSKHKVRLNPNTQRAWRTLFLVIGFLVLIFIGLTYYLAYAANSSSSILSFASTVQSSSKVGIVLNGTATPQMISCANLLYNQSLTYKKNATIAYVSGITCTINGSPYTSSQCLNSFVAKGTPIIVLTNSNAPSIMAYSMYGTALYASGNSTFMAACYPSLFLK